MEVQTRHNVVIEKEYNTYYFSIPNNAPFGEAYDAAFEAMSYVKGMLDEKVKEAEERNSKESCCDGCQSGSGCNCSCGHSCGDE